MTDTDKEAVEPGQIAYPTTATHWRVEVYALDWRALFENMVEKRAAADKAYKPEFTLALHQGNHIVYWFKKDQWEAGDIGRVFGISGEQLATTQAAGKPIQLKSLEKAVKEPTVVGVWGWA